MCEFKYRPDIDGLRAVAVLLVLFFHADLGFPGGFVGVDVFFVISGFLITGLIIKQQRRNDFHLNEFWIRRIRRIVPASTVVVLTTLIAGFFILLPQDYTKLAQSVGTQQLMLSNIFFWRNTGYFAGNAEQMPLLHTWSLAVEEQFYIGYPFVLLFVIRFSRNVSVTLLLSLTILSLALSAWGVYTYAGATFYLLPTRAWEMGLGGILCFVPVPLRNSALIANVMSLIGFAGIVVAACCFSSTTPFPGLAALLPCVATMLVIYGNSMTTTLVGTALSARPVVYCGLMSYSLYLWHWPILSFLAHMCCGARPDTASRIGALAASFLCALLSLRYVESPFRTKKLCADTRTLLCTICSASALVLISSAFIAFFRGFPQRFDQRAISFASAASSMAFIHEMSPNQVREGTIPTFGVAGGANKCLIWGDSHAMALIPGIDAACKSRTIQGFQATHSSTAPIVDFVSRYKYGLGPESPDFSRSVIRLANDRRVDLVILAANWSMYDTQSDFERCLSYTIQQLSDAGIRVAIVRDVAAQKGNTPLVLSMAVRRGQDVRTIGVPLDEHLRLCEVHNRVFDRLSDRNVVILDPTPFFVDGAGLWRAEYDGNAMYRDAGHLTVEGSLRLTALWEELFDSVLCSTVNESTLPRTVISGK